MHVFSGVGEEHAGAAVDPTAVDEQRLATVDLPSTRWAARAARLARWVWRWLAVAGAFISAGGIIKAAGGDFDWESDWGFAAGAALAFAFSFVWFLLMDAWNQRAVSSPGPPH